MKTGKSSNIFSILTSVQGEGLFIGMPQIFIRFTGCNIRCKYCDTPEALVPQTSARIETTAFSNKIRLVPNPLSVEDVTKIVHRLSRAFRGFHSIVLTGGEPLLFNEFLQRLLPRLKNSGLVLFLETNGTLTEQLDSVIGFIDIISMDIKIPSSTVGKFSWGDVAEFLKIGSRKQIYVKVVVSDGDSKAEYIRVRGIIRKINPNIPVILQPVSSHRPPSLKRLWEIYRIFRVDLKDIRIIPQVHKLMGWA